MPTTYLPQKITTNLLTAIETACSSEGFQRVALYLSSGEVPIKVYTRAYYTELIVSKAFDNVTDDELGKSIACLYGAAWDRILEALGLEYNPIYNVSEHATETHSGEDSTTGGVQSITTVSQTTLGTKDTSTGYVVPYDSNSESEANKNESTFNHTTTVTPSGDNDETTTYGHVVEKDREGNIGFMSNQYLIEEEIKLRLNHLFLPVLCMDIADFLTDGLWGDD